MLMLGSSYASAEMVNYAKSLGVYTIVTDYLEPNKSKAKLVSDEYWMINTADIDVLEKKCREVGVDAVICGASEFNIEKTMELCKRLNLPSYCTPEAWHYSRDKDDFKKLCIEIGAPVAKDFYLTKEFNRQDLDKVSYPVVVKPVDLSGNRGINYCYNESELIKNYKYALSVSKSEKIIVEKMLHGKEWYAYYVLAEGEIKLLALNAMYAQPGELSNLYSLTTSISDEVKRFNQEINEKIIDVLKKVGCKEGIAWVQVMLDDDNHFYIIEMGYRLPGDMPFIFYNELFNFDSIKWLVDYSLGKKHSVSELPPAQTSSIVKCGISYSLWTKNDGIIKSISGLDGLQKTGKYKFFSPFNIGDSYGFHRSIGVLTFSADGIDEILEMLQKVNDSLIIKNEKNEDVFIKYTNFDFLRKVYKKGLAE